MSKLTDFKTFLTLAFVMVVCGMLYLYSQLDHRRGIPAPNTFNIARTRVVEESVMVRPCDCEEKEPQTTIPNIIHQVWNGEIVPTVFIEHVRSLVRDNPYPEWQYYFWTRASGAKFIKDKYPYLLDRYNDEKLTSNTMRADMLRILAIHEYGGVYFDLDTISVRPLSGFVDKHECALATEPREHFIPQNVDLLLTNSALLCRSKHPFYKHLLYRLSTLKDDCENAFLCTGPLMLTPLYNELKRANGDAVKLPDVQPSKFFQDAYDTNSDGLFKEILEACSAKNAGKRSAVFDDLCREWEERGRGNRKLSNQAYTYHTWFHVYGKVLEELPRNSIFDVIPHAKVYGHNL